MRFLVLMITICGCATMPQGGLVEVMTDPPGGAVSVNGAYVGDAPVMVNLPSRCVWVGLMNSPSGYDCQLVRVQAEPRSGMTGRLFSRTAMVNPGEMASRKILLNLHMETMSPTQTVEVK
jgi:hypothetical protein